MDGKDGVNASISMTESGEPDDDTILLSIRTLKQWKIPERTVVSVVIVMFDVQ
jgi:hypothetical protein